AAVLGVVDFVVDGDAGAAELREHGVEVADAVVHHARLVEVLRRRGKDRPGRVAEHRAAVRRIDVDAEFVAVPVAQRGRIVRLDENAADAGDLFHRYTSSSPNRPIAPERYVNFLGGRYEQGRNLFKTR